MSNFAFFLFRVAAGCMRSFKGARRPLAACSFQLISKLSNNAAISFFLSLDREREGLRPNKAHKKKKKFMFAFIFYSRLVGFLQYPRVEYEFNKFLPHYANVVIAN